MIIEFLKDMGAWGWILAGLIFLVIEIILPGFLFLWLGIGALVVGAIGLLDFVGAGWNSTSVQFITFAVISLAAAFAGRSLYNPRHSPSDEPLLNQRGSQLIGRSVVLSEPIEQGTGRVKIGDTIWRVTGPDSPAGTQLTVISADGSNLILGNATSET